MRHKIFLFGNAIPTGDDNDFFVAWQQEGAPGGVLVGPFDRRKDAEDEMNDALEMGDAKDARVVKRSELHRIEFFPYVESR